MNAESTIDKDKKIQRRESSFVIPGDPIPWKRSGKNGRMFYDQQTHEKLATGLFITNQFTNQSPFSGPIHLDITFFFVAPKTKKEIKNKLIGRHTAYHHIKPDLDNLCKYILDVSNKLLFADDCIIASLNAKKVYALKPRTEFTIMELK